LVVPPDSAHPLRLHLPTFAADVVFRRQHFAMTLRYIRQAT
jgi:hypothetical protein